tara:strand:+ start:1110 stop:2822 length:1713 start_codon:yes stop_codon:yes gene_type:complete
MQDDFKKKAEKEMARLFSAPPTQPPLAVSVGGTPQPQMSDAEVEMQKLFGVGAQTLDAPAFSQSPTQVEEFGGVGPSVDFPAMVAGQQAATARRIEGEDKAFVQNNLLGEEFLGSMWGAVTNPDFGLDVENKKAVMQAIDNNISSPTGKFLAKGITHIGGEVGAAVLDLMSGAVEGSAREIAAQIRDFGGIKGDKEYEEAVEGIDEFLNIGLLVTGQQPKSPRMRPKTSKELRMDAPEDAPYGVTIQEQAKEIFKKVDALPIALKDKTNSFGKAISKAEAHLDRAVVDESRGFIQAHLRNMQRGLLQEGDIPLSELLVIRKSLSRKIFNTSDPQVRYDLYPVLNDFDEMALGVNKLKPTGGTTALSQAEWSQIPEFKPSIVGKATADIKEARKTYKRAMKTMDLEDAIDSGSSGLQSERVAIPNKFQVIVDMENRAIRHKWPRRYEAGELKLMREIAKGGNWVGKLYNTVGGFGKMAVKTGDVMNPKVALGFGGRRAGEVDALTRARDTRNLVASGKGSDAYTPIAPRASAGMALVGQQGIQRPQNVFTLSEVERNRQAMQNRLNMGLPK